MYTKEKKNGRLINFILGILAIIIIIFVIIWIINKGHTTSRNTKMFNDNLNAIHETANKYFNKNLPENIGETYKVSLKEMYALGLSEKLYYGNDACDADDSYISVTKTDENDYKVTSKLVCSDKADSIISVIKLNDTNTNTTDTNTTTNTNTNVTTNTNITVKNNTNKTNTNKNTSCPSSNKTCNITGNCKTNITPTDCVMTYEYEYVAKTYGCPSGYTETTDGRCAKTITDTKEVTLTPSTTVKDAKKTSNTTSKVYTNTIVTPGTETKYCTTGELKNGKCYSYTEKKSNTTYTYSCPSGYTQSGTGADTKCTKNTTSSVNPTKTANDTYSCPSGYTKSGSGANTKCTKNSTVSADPIKKAVDTYSCPSGYTKSGSGADTKCTKNTTTTTNYVLGYTAWGNPDKVFDSNTKLEVYTKELEKLIQTGSTCKTLFGKTTCVYAYEHYSRKYTYSCPSGYTQSGTGTNTKCSKNTTSSVAPTKSTSYTYSCPSGYTQSGTGTSTKCTKNTTSSVNPTKSTSYTYSCPSGYTQSGTGASTKCSKTVSSSVTPNKKANTTYSCPSGYTDNGNKCYKTTTPSTKTSSATYSCPTGYKAEGTGSNTKCYKNVTVEGEYYCEDANAVRSGNKCYITNNPTTSCPTDYKLTNNQCVKTTTVYTDKVSTGSKYIYSTATSLEGYTRTGYYRYTNICTAK